MKYVLILTILCQMGNATIVGFAQNSGANCINGALTKSHLLKGHRYSSNSEITLLLKSRLCKKITSNDPNNFNTIGIIHSESPNANPNIISHAFIHINETLAFEKKGYDISEPYQFTELQSIFNEYELVHPETSVEYYKCHPLKSLFSSPSLNEGFKNYLIRFDQLDEEIDKRGKLKRSDINSIKKEVINLVRDLRPKGPNLSEDDLLALNIMASRVVSIAGQLNASGDDELRNQTWPWEFEVHNIQNVLEFFKN